MSRPVPSRPTRSLGSGDRPDRPRAIKTDRCSRGEIVGSAPRAVTIRALGWRLRLELRHTQYLRANPSPSKPASFYWTVAAIETAPYFLFRENQRNPVKPNNARFRISGHKVPVFSTERPKQPQSILKPRTMALSNAPENRVSNVASQISAPLSHRPTKRQIPTHSSKAGRKTARAAVAGQGVSW
jgi:hypothetical protein